VGMTGGRPCYRNQGRRFQVAVSSANRALDGGTMAAMPDPPRKCGRPPIDPAGSCAVTIALSITTYDALYARAARERISVPELIRRELRRGQARPDDPPR
jgi:hypothetical protein